MKNLDFEKILSAKQEHLSHPIIIYGAGVGGEYYIRLLKDNYGIKPAAVCDTYKAGQKILGYDIYPIEDVIGKFEDPRVIIASLNYYTEIKNMLLNYFPESAFFYPADTTPERMAAFKEYVNTHREELNRLYNIFEDDKSRDTLDFIIKARITAEAQWMQKAFSEDQYFCDDIITLTDKESFIDGGAYVGDTAEIFIKKTGGRFNKIYCFEPGASNYKRLLETKRRLGDDERIHTFRAGLYSENTRLGFDDNDISACNAINTDKQNNAEMIDVMAIDKVIKDEVTFIKMDIEGAEMEALKGAKETILKNRPKLAICVYHKASDILDIPHYIMSLGLDYKYYLRHHNPNSISETVLYAI